MYHYTDCDGAPLALGDEFEIVDNKTLKTTFAPVGARGRVTQAHDEGTFIGRFPEGTWPSGHSWSNTLQYLCAQNVRKVQAAPTLVDELTRLLTGGAS